MNDDIDIYFEQKETIEKINKEYEKKRNELRAKESYDLLEPKLVQDKAKESISKKLEDIFLTNSNKKCKTCKCKTEDNYAPGDTFYLNTLFENVIIFEGINQFDEAYMIYRFKDKEELKEFIESNE